MQLLPSHSYPSRIRVHGESDANRRRPFMIISPSFTPSFPHNSRLCNFGINFDSECAESPKLGSNCFWPVRLSALSLTPLIFSPTERSTHFFPHSPLPP